MNEYMVNTNEYRRYEAVKFAIESFAAVRGHPSDLMIVRRAERIEKYLKTGETADGSS